MIQSLGPEQASKDGDPKPKGLPVLAAIYLFAVVLPIGFNAGPLYLTTLRIFLLVLVIPLFGQLLSGRYGRLYWTDGLFILHILFMAIALWLSSPQQVVTQIGSMGVEFIGGYLVGRATIRSRSDFIALCKWLVMIVLCLLPFSLYEAKTGVPPIVAFLHKIPGIKTVEMLHIDARLGLERVQNSFAHPIHYGLFCSVAFSLCFVALQDVYSNMRRYVSSGLILLSGFLALSSGALLALVLQISLISWSMIFAKIEWRWKLLLGCFAVAYVIVDLLSNRTPLQVFMSYATFSAHNAYWRSIIFDWGIRNIFGDSEAGIPPAMWFGIGMNDWVRPWFMRSGSMDNFWLVIGVRYGVTSFLLLAIGYGLLILQAMRRNFDADPEMSRIRRAWVFTFLGLSFTLSTVHIWTNIYSFVFFMFGAGVWIIAEASRDGTQEHSDDPAPEQKAARTPYSRFPVDKTRYSLPASTRPRAS